MKLSPVKDCFDGKRRVMFLCPGCKCVHQVCVDGGRPCWDWNGNSDAPTFSPSILVTVDFGERHEKKVCHSFVRDGRIQFLGDCTHALAGQTVELPDWEEADWETVVQ